MRLFNLIQCQVCMTNSGYIVRKWIIHLNLFFRSSFVRIGLQNKLFFVPVNTVSIYGSNKDFGGPKSQNICFAFRLDNFYQYFQYIIAFVRLCVYSISSCTYKTKWYAILGYGINHCAIYFDFSRLQNR